MPEQFEICCARVFTSREGKIVLEHLRALTLERALGMQATDAEIRYLEGQRGLIKMIENMVRRGKDE